MKRSIKHFLDDIIEYCDIAYQFTDNLTLEEFMEDNKTFLLYYFIVGGTYLEKDSR